MSEKFFQFHYKDWLVDTALSSCSLEAQGLWIRMLCLAAQCDPVGYLRHQGRPLDGERLLRALGLGGVSVAKMTRLIDELEEAGVPSRDSDGALYSRRMVRDNENRRFFEEAGRKGGLMSKGKGPLFDGDPQGNPQGGGYIPPRQKASTRASYSSDETRTNDPVLEEQKQGALPLTPSFDIMDLISGRPDAMWIRRSLLPAIAKGRRDLLPKVLTVWDAWKACFPGEHVLTKARFDAVARWLEGAIPPYTVEMLCQVPTGVTLSEFHMGEPRYQDVASIFGSATKIDSHLARARGQGRQGPTGVSDTRKHAGSISPSENQEWSSADELERLAKGAV